MDKAQVQETSFLQELWRIRTVEFEKGRPLNAKRFYRDLFSKKKDEMSVIDYLNSQEVLIRKIYEQGVGRRKYSIAANLKGPTQDRYVEAI